MTYRSPPPEKERRAGGGSGAARLRDHIDHGGGKDKVSHPDPAAAPLGTDDEAAGTGPTRRQVRMAEAHEVRSPAEDRERAGGSVTSGHGKLKTFNVILWAVLLALVAVAVWLAWTMT